MSNEEAIKVLGGLMPPVIRGNGKSTAHLITTLAISKAIEALKAEPIKHGRWIHVSGSEPYDEYVCSVCGTKASSFIGGTEMWYCLTTPDYCPHCGAIMDGEENDNG